MHLCLSILVFLLTILKLVLNSKRARCYMTPQNGSIVSGQAKFYQENESSPVQIELAIYLSRATYEFHIHEGNGESGCENIEEYINKNNSISKHSTPKNRHIGDMEGTSNSYGKEVIQKLTSDKISLYEGDENILAKSCSLHEKKHRSEKLENKEFSCGKVQHHEPTIQIFYGLFILALGSAIAYLYFFHFNKKRTQYSQTG
jgi:hypothetical protein